MGWSAGLLSGLLWGSGFNQAHTVRFFQLFTVVQLLYMIPVRCWVKVLVHCVGSDCTMHILWTILIPWCCWQQAVYMRCNKISLATRTFEVENHCEGNTSSDGAYTLRKDLILALQKLDRWQNRTVWIWLKARFFRGFAVLKHSNKTLLNEEIHESYIILFLCHTL